jgi:hypothetical protein
MRLQNLIVTRLIQILAKATVAFVAAGCFALATHGSGEVQAATASNSQAALGMNLAPVSYYTAEQPFLNILKTTGITQAAIGWSTMSSSGSETNEERSLQLDASGYPTTLKANSSDANQQFTQACTLFLRNLPASNAGTGPVYRAGQYVVLYDGQGTLSFNFDAKLVSSSPGQYVFNVATPTWGGGVDMCITSTDPNNTGNYLRNIRVVYAGDEASLNAGNVFSSSFLSLMQNFKVLRFMDWLSTNNNPPGNWADRPQATDAGWGTSNGVPFEAIFELCNAVNADCWINVPHTADDDYIMQLAALAHSMLGTSQQLYIELSNEVWNSAFPQYQYAIAQGLALWPSNTNAFTANRDWYGMRTAQMCDIVASVWGGDFSRVHCVLGAQAANPWTATQSLSCPLWTGAGNAPCAAHHITDVAIAPYFGFTAPASWSTNSQSTNVNLLFQELNQGGVVPGGYAGGELKQSSDWEAAYATALAPFKLPLIAYEGGQTFVAFPNGTTNGSNSWLTNLYIAANQDPRMGSAYASALNSWKSNGGHVYLPYNDIGAPSQYGEWGALQSFMDTVSPLSSAPAKWQAIQNFLSSTSCWWSACAGSIGGSGPSVPKAPSNVSVN